MSGLVLRVQTGETYFEVSRCISLALEREIYTPYEALSGLFCIDADFDVTNVTQLELFWNGNSIFLGIADQVVTFRRGGVWFLRIHSKTFTSLLTQNELEPGLYSNITIQHLIYNFYQLPHVTVKWSSESGYIYARERTSLWDSVTSFVYKQCGRYPYVVNNEVCYDFPETPNIHTPDESAVTELGSGLDTTRLISHYHMADIEGNPNAYEEENPAAQYAQIVRHKQIAFDREFLSDPTSALTYRNLFSFRGDKSRYVTYAGFNNEVLGEKVTFGMHLQNAVICRVRMVYGAQGFATTLWTYEDGFYHLNA